METKRMFPLFIDLSKKHVTVIGGGKIAERRLLTLVNFTSNIKVIAPEITSEIHRLFEENKIAWMKKPFEAGDTLGADLVLAITDSKEVNSAVYRECCRNNILVSNAGDREQCQFHFPGVIIHDDIVIGFNGGGNNHSKTKQTRVKVEEFLNSQDK